MEQVNCVFVGQVLATPDGDEFTVTNLDSYAKVVSVLNLDGKSGAIHLVEMLEAVRSGLLVRVFEPARDCDD